MMPPTCPASQLRQIQRAVEKEEVGACDDLFNFRSVAWRPVVVLA